MSVVQKQSLTNKLISIVGDYQASDLSSMVDIDTLPKRNNRYVIYTIDALKQAIISNRQVSFKYYSLDYQKNRVYHNNSERYVVNPLVVVWNKDHYYLICFDGKHDGIAHYRVDRMESAMEEPTVRTHRKELSEFDVEKYRQRVFSMFGGHEQEVELQFNSDMIDDIYDKFGEDISIIKICEDTYYVKVPLQVSKTFLHG